MCYATVALATDYDCWKKGEAPVNVEQVIGHLKRCVQNAKRLLAGALRAFPARWDCRCGSAMENAVLTAPEAVPAAARRRLRLLLPADFFTKRK
jgi:5'-methylthioadenosine phosphorylase